MFTMQLQQGLILGEPREVDICQPINIRWPPHDNSGPYYVTQVFTNAPAPGFIESLQAFIGPETVSSEVPCHALIKGGMSLRVKGRYTGLIPEGQDKGGSFLFVVEFQVISE